MSALLSFTEGAKQELFWSNIKQQVNTWMDIMAPDSINALYFKVTFKHEDSGKCIDVFRVRMTDGFARVTDLQELLPPKVVFSLDIIFYRAEDVNAVTWVLEQMESVERVLVLPDRNEWYLAREYFLEDNNDNSTGRETFQLSGPYALGVEFYSQVHENLVIDFSEYGTLAGSFHGKNTV